MNVLADDCFLHDRDRLTHAEALALISERLACVAGTEHVGLAEAPGRVTARELTAPRPIPAHDNAAVDGYAYKWTAEETERGRAVVARTAAGDERATIGDEDAARIFTGAPMPAGADTVAMQEDCRRDGDRVHLPQLRRGANRRLAGEDVREGEAIVGIGRVLRPQDIAAVASAGLPGLEVRQRLRVSLISTGNELLQPGEAFVPGAVYDSNRPMLRTLLSRATVELRDLGHVRDDRVALETALEAAAATSDMVVTSGGASRGEEDHVLGALDAVGTRHLWQLAVKPGRPMMMGQIGDCVVVGLPGNPVAAMVCALLYGRPIIDILAGTRPREPRRYPLPAAFSLRSKPDRREFLRGSMMGSGANARAAKFDRDGSGLITGLRASDGLIEIPEDVTEIRDGDTVGFIPYSEWGIVG